MRKKGRKRKVGAKKEPKRDETAQRPQSTTDTDVHDSLSQEAEACNDDVPCMKSTDCLCLCWRSDYVCVAKLNTWFAQKVQKKTGSLNESKFSRSLRLKAEIRISVFWVDFFLCVASETLEMMGQKIKKLLGWISTNCFTNWHLWSIKVHIMGQVDWVQRQVPGSANSHSDDRSHSHSLSWPRCNMNFEKCIKCNYHFDSIWKTRMCMTCKKYLKAKRMERFGAATEALRFSNIATRCLQRGLGSTATWVAECVLWT